MTTRPPRTANASPRILSLVGAAMNAQIELEKAEAEFKNKKAIFRDLLENVIPEAMEAAELDVAVLPTGDHLVVKTVTRASITQEHRESAFEYLRANGLDAMIKGTFTVQFGLKEYSTYLSFTKMMARLYPELPIAVIWTGPEATSDRGVIAALETLIRNALGTDRKITGKETVPGATLLSFVKKQLDAGTEFPAELFGAVRIREANWPGLKPQPSATEELMDG